MGNNNKCRICNSKNIHKHEHPDYSYCLNCNTIFQDTPVVPVEDYYNGRICNQSNQYKYYLDYIDKLKNNISDIDLYTIIDLGCGDGTFLKALQKKGLKNICGIESSEIAIEHCKKRNLQLIDFNQIKNIDKKIITLWQVIEHFKDPEKFLREIKEQMRTGDYIVITTPCTDSKYRFLNGRNWYSLSPHHHLFLFSRESLKLLFQRNEFEIRYFTRVIAGIKSINSYYFYMLKKQFKYFLFLKKTKKPRAFLHNSMFAIFQKK